MKFSIPSIGSRASVKKDAHIQSAVRREPAFYIWGELYEANKSFLSFEKDLAKKSVLGGCRYVVSPKAREVFRGWTSRLNVYKDVAIHKESSSGLGCSSYWSVKHTLDEATRKHLEPCILQDPLQLLFIDAPKVLKGVHNAPVKQSIEGKEIIHVFILYFEDGKMFLDLKSSDPNAEYNYANQWLLRCSYS